MRSAIKNSMKQRIKDFETVQDCVDAAFRGCQTRFLSSPIL